MPLPIGMDIFTASSREVHGGNPARPLSQETLVPPEIEPQPILVKLPVAEAIYQTLRCSFCDEMPNKSTYKYHSCEGGHFVCSGCQDVQMDRCMKKMEVDYVPPGNDLIENDLNDSMNSLENNCQNKFYGMPTPHPLLTKMLETSKLICKYHLEGCCEERLPTQLKQHEERCKYNPKNKGVAPGEMDLV